MPDRLGLFAVIVVTLVISGDVIGTTPARILRKLIKGTPLTYDGAGFSGKAKMLLLDIITCSIVVGGLMLVFQ